MPIAILVGAAQLACVAPGFFSERPSACGNPDFPYVEGWLGGDAAYSVQLSERVTLWLFGDSFVGSPQQSDRIGASFIHNSIALSECQSDGSWEFDYWWGVGEDGSPRAFFRPQNGEGYYWPLDGFVHESRLYVALLRVEKSEPRGALQLPFRFRGVDLARVENPHASPENWRFEALPLSRSEAAFPASSMVVHGEHVYLFTFLALEDDRSPRLLARLPLQVLSEDAVLEEGLEYLDESGNWKPRMDPRAAKVLMDDDASEMTVRFHPEIGHWVAVYGHPRRSDDSAATEASDRVYLRTASALEGPWSAPRTVFRIPELSEAQPGDGDPNLFCYAGKEHPQLAAPGRLLLTYVCNLFTLAGQNPYEPLSRLQRRMDLYRPRAVEIAIPAVNGATPGSP